MLNYFASNNLYTVSYGPAGGTLFSTGAVALFRNPTNPMFEGLRSVQFYSYVNGAALDDVRLSVIESASPSIQSVAYYDDDQLLGVLTSPGTNGWSLSHALASRGVHGLTAVATDAFGTQSTAYRAVVASQPIATGVTHYRFERSPGLKADQYDFLNLATNANAGAGPQQVALGSSGAGATFPRLFAGSFGQNDCAARLQAANGDAFVHCSDEVHLFPR